MPAAKVVCVGLYPDGNAPDMYAGFAEHMCDSRHIDAVEGRGADESTQRLVTQMFVA